MPFTMKDARELGEAVSFWIGFRTLLGRQDHLSERSLSEPISDFLISRARPWALHSEFNHPIIQAPKRGRPKQFDYALLQNHRICACIETKFGSCNPVELINDLLRLALLPKVHRFFLHVLRDEEFKSLYEMRMRNDGGPIRKLTQFLDMNQKARINFGVLANYLDNNPTRYDKWLAGILSGFEEGNPLVGGRQLPGGMTSTMIQFQSIAGFTTYVLRVGRLTRVASVNFARMGQLGISDEEANEP